MIKIKFSVGRPCSRLNYPLILSRILYVHHVLHMCLTCVGRYSWQSILFVTPCHQLQAYVSLLTHTYISTHVIHNYV